MQFSTEASDNLPLFDVKFTAVRDFKDEIVESVENAAAIAANFAASNAPSQSGRLRNSIYHTKARYRPGGAGGGGVYTAEVGIHETMAPHASWLLQGTGIHGPDANPIFPRKDRGTATLLFKTVVDQNGDLDFYKRRSGKKRKDQRRKGSGAFMTFQKQGEPRRFRRMVEGQPAQTAWWEGAQELANLYMAAKVNSK